MKPIAWYDPSNGVVSTDQDCPLFTPLGQVWALYPEPEPVAWVGLDLDSMAEAFHRVIEEHHSRNNPFHDPVNGDAMIALRELRGLIAYMKCNTTPPQRTWVGLTDVEIVDIMDVELTTQNTEHFALCRAIEAKLREKNT